MRIHATVEIGVPPKNTTNVGIAGTIIISTYITMSAKIERLRRTRSWREVIFGTWADAVIG